MQYDMHYYGTYAMAVAAGFSKEDAETIAYASQHVDDQNHQDVTSVRQIDGELCEAVIGIPTAHHPIDTGLAAEVGHIFREATAPIKRLLTTTDMGKDDCRLVWVPFHFLPGNHGKTYLEKVICQKDSAIAREMLDHHLGQSGEEFFLQLVGIAAHTYADTFSHFGFAGVTSPLNAIDVGTVRVADEHNVETKQYVEGKARAFQSLYALIENAPHLGHGGVDTCPDRPYLRWSFEYANGERVERNNHEHFLEACKQLHAFLTRAAQARVPDAAHQSQAVTFDKIEGTVSAILAKEGSGAERSEAWLQAMKDGTLAHVQPCEPYDESAWLAGLVTALQERNFNKIKNSDAYRFHTAAEYHRHYVLKRLLPKHGVIVA